MNTAIERKDKKTLTELAKEFRNASVSKATRRAYKSDWLNFVSFCDYRDENALPASSSTVCMFLTELADMGKSVATIVRALTALNKAHELAGYGSVRNHETRLLMKGIKRKKGKPADQVKGITYDEIIKMALLCENTLLGVRDRAVLMLGWCSAFRRSELVALNIGDLEFTEQGLIITVCKSKTDQEAKGQQIGIPYSKDIICPVKAVQEWISRIDTRSIGADTPLFRAVGMAGQKLWVTKTGGRLSARMVSLTVKRYANRCGLHSEKYASHSLRRGLATEAGARRIPERIIARHTRHISMAVLRQYIEAGTIWTENPLTAIYTPSSSSVSSSE